MQAKQELEASYDWHQKLILEHLKAPLVETRSGLAFTSIGHLLKFDLTNEFPATKAKKLFFDTVVRELYCFLKGRTDKEFLHEHGVHIWDANMEAAQMESLGYVYGKLWREWGGYKDQLQEAVNLLKKSSTTRRALITAWHPEETHWAALPSCHVMFQFNIVGDTLYTDVFQRSADLFLGLPFDIAEYAILSRLVNNELGGEYKEILNYHISNLHLYKDHEEQAKQELANVPGNYKPVLSCSLQGINNFDYKNCIIFNYPESRVIKAKMNL